MKEYLTVEGECRTEYEIKRSVFIAAAKNIASYEEGVEFALAERKKYSDATHICYAFRLLSGEQKFSDDGEPSGTAGQPIMQVLKNKDLFNTIICVTRYFGGIKLGGGGLVSAYTESAVKAVDCGKTIKMRLMHLGEVTVTYSESQIVLNKFQAADIVSLDIKYSSEVIITFGAADKITGENILLDVTSGRVQPHWHGQNYIKV